jgi:hypothetical protein
MEKIKEHLKCFFFFNKKMMREIEKRGIVIFQLC